MTLFAELKRRKVFRVAVVYAATALAVLQAADITRPLRVGRTGGYGSRTSMI